MMNHPYGAPNDTAEALYDTVLSWSIQNAKTAWQREYVTFVLGVLHSSDRSRPVPVIGSPETARYRSPQT